MPWSTLMEVALYGPGGFYTGGGGAGRGRDFLTSPELGGLFGAVVARAIDELWDRAGRPDPWLVVEAGAASGALAEAVLAAAPRCAPALRYVMVEISPTLRTAAGRRLALEEPAQVLGPVAAPDPDEEGADARRMAGVGPLVAMAVDLPAGPFTGLIVANELLDNLAFDIYERTDRAWQEVRVASGATGFVEVTVAASDTVAAQLERLAPDAPPGSRVPWQHAAMAWVERALALVERGALVAIDYSRPTAELAAVGGWMRTYRRGGPGGVATSHIGEMDITADVAGDQLSLVRPPTRTRPQWVWLDAYGLAELEGQAARDWHGAAAAPDLAALRARSQVSEARALRDPDGLGGFEVFEWLVGLREE